MTENFPVSIWMLLFALIGSGIDYLRTKAVDKNVLCFFSLAGFLSGSAFHWAGALWGDAAAVASGIVTTTVIGLVSVRYIREYIIGLQRDSVSQQDQEWYQRFKREVEQERKNAKRTSETGSASPRPRCGHKSGSKKQKGSL